MNTFQDTLRKRSMYHYTNTYSKNTQQSNKDILKEIDQDIEEVNKFLQSIKEQRDVVVNNLV